MDTRSGDWTRVVVITVDPDSESIRAAMERADDLAHEEQCRVEVDVYSEGLSHLVYVGMP